MRKICAMTAGVGLLVTAGVLAPVAASAATDAVSFVTGTAQHADGKPFAAGAIVAVFAEEPTTANADRDLRSVAVGSGSVGANGQFEVKVADTATVSEFADAAGLVDLQVKAVDGNSFAPYSMTRRVVTTADGVLLQDPVVDAASARAAAAEPIVVRATTTIDSLESVGLGPSRDVRPAGESEQAPFTQVCGKTTEKSLGARRVLVGASYALPAGTTGTFTYKRGATTSIQVASSASGKGGTWTRGSSVAKNSSATVGYGGRNGGKAYHTYFTFHQYADWCRPLSGGPNRVYNYRVLPSGFAGGATITSAPAPSARYCTPFPNQVSLNKSSSSSNSWSNAVNFAGPLGVNLSAKTGWTSAASLSYKNSSGRTKQICGTKGYWGKSPERGVVK